MTPVYILGIDPGSHRTGYGIIRAEGARTAWVAHGHIATRAGDVSQRLRQIHETLIKVIEEHQPQEIAVEQVFVNINAQTALKLGQARGAALVAVGGFNLPVAEYSPRRIKQTVAGYGGATKEQVQHMIKLLLKMPETPQADAADALAIALCHCQHRQFARKLQGLL